MRNSLRADNHVVLVDDGDAIQGETIGTLTKGAIIELMNVVGYDIAIPAIMNLITAWRTSSN